MSVKSTPKKSSRGTKKAAVPQGVFQQIPLSQLRLSPRNVRSEADRTPEDIASLVESIAHVGVIQNLVVTAQADGLFDVEAGGRRLLACQQLVADKRLPKDHPVNCLVVADDAALTASLTENTLRKDMNPVDEFLAFQKLIEAGKSVEDVAAAFGVTPAVVTRRLKLANVSPRLLADFREGEIELQQLMALAVVDDHAAQEQAFYDAPEYHRQPQRLKAMLMTGALAANHPVAAYVTVEAYEAAGGSVKRDLFAENGSGVYLTDKALVEKLAREKLAAEAEAILGQGWKWVDVVPFFNSGDFYCMNRVHPRHRPLTEAEGERVKTIRARQQEIEDRIYGDEDVPEDEQATLEAESEQLEAEVDAIHEGCLLFGDEQRAVAGCIVTLDADGVTVHRGAVRDEDVDAFKALSKPQSATTSPAGGAEAAEEAPGLSDKQARRLSAHRAKAMQACMAAQPQVALAAVVHTLLLPLLHRDHWNRLPVNIRVERPNLKDAAEDVDNSPAARALDAALATHTAGLPTDRDALLDALLVMPQDRLVQLLAVCAAFGTGIASGNVREGRVEALARALKLDMTEWWSATAESYFAQVPKALTLEAVQAFAPEKVEGLAKLKKGDLAQEAEKLAAGTGWLPSILLTTEDRMQRADDIVDAYDDEGDYEDGEDDMAA